MSCRNRLGYDLLYNQDRTLKEVVCEKWERRMLSTSMQKLWIEQDLIEEERLDCAVGSGKTAGEGQG